MRCDFRGIFLGAAFGVFAGAIFVVSGCGSSGATVPWRQVDRAGQPGVENLFLGDNDVMNAFNFLSPNGDEFNLASGTVTSVSTQYQKVLTAFAALGCYVRAAINNANLKPFGRTCDAGIDLSTGAAPAAFTTWLTTDGVGAGEKFSVVQRFEATFLPDVLRLDTDVTFANRGVLRYVYDDVTTESPLICSPGTGSRPRTYCGGRRFGEDAIRFLYSQMFLGSVGSIQPNLDTVQDDGLAGTTILATFPYLDVPTP